MSKTTNIPFPPQDFAGVQKYSIKPREKRAFHTILDAKKILASGQDPTSVITYSQVGDGIVVAMEHPIAGGKMREEMTFGPTRDGLVVQTLERAMFDGSGRQVRTEVVPDFRHDDLGLPSATYPEVVLPFLLAWMPLDGERRSVYAWINDRFLAKVYVEVDGKPTLTVGGVSHETFEVIMYPDLNDWIHMGPVISRMIKPFVPKYRMWYQRKAPHRLVRFEGPYGPPGAPEVVLEVKS